MAVSSKELRGPWIGCGGALGITWVTVCVERCSGTGIMGGKCLYSDVVVW